MRLRDVNTTDIADAIRLGCRTMQSVFNADDNDIPFFDSEVRPRAFLGFQCPYHEAHVPGRHLNALLTAEAVLGVTLDEGAVKKHARAAFYSYGGPLPLPLNREHLGGRPIVFADHNLREGFHALHALVKYRGDERARALADASIEAVFEYWHPQRGWDVPRLEALGLKVQARRLVWGPARAVGPLVKYYRATGHARALELALLIAEQTLEEAFREDGGFDPQRFGWHTHSTTCTMSSLAQLADLLGDGRLMERVRTFYDRGLWDIRDELGWVIEQAQPPAGWTDRGEINNTGDIVETALILGRWGYDQYYHDAERILRCHLLPSQLRDISFITDPPNPDGQDGLRDVAGRHRGAFGFPAPYGHQPVGMDLVAFNLDIVGGGVASLCEAWREMATRDEAGHHVNLLFDRETPALRVESPYPAGTLRITMQQPGPLWVRVPPWAARERVRVVGTDQPPHWRGQRLFLAQPSLGRPIEIAFPLAEQELVLRHRERAIRVHLRGDEVAAMDDFGADLTFFPPYNAAASGV